MKVKPEEAEIQGAADNLRDAALVHQSADSLLFALIEARRYTDKHEDFRAYGNYAHHFARTALYLFMELEKRGLLEPVMADWSNSMHTAGGNGSKGRELDEFIRKLSGEVEMSASGTRVEV